LDITDEELNSAGDKLWSSYTDKPVFLLSDSILEYMTGDTSFFLISTVSNGEDISSSLLSAFELCGEEKSSLLSNNNSREENVKSSVKIKSSAILICKGLHKYEYITILVTDSDTGYLGDDLRR